MRIACKLYKKPRDYNKKNCARGSVRFGSDDELRELQYDKVGWIITDMSAQVNYKKQQQ